MRGAPLAPAGRRVRLARTQAHHSMEGRTLVREATLAEYRDDPRVVHHGAAEAEAVELWAGRTIASRHNLSAPDMVFRDFRPN